MKKEPICIQTGIICGFPCWHKCPRYDDIGPKKPQETIKQFKKCGIGENVCKCENETQCGYK